MISLFFKKYLINFIFILLFIYFIFLDHPINIYVTLISLFCLIHIIKNFEKLKNEFNDKSSDLVYYFFSLYLKIIIKKKIDLEFLSFLRFFFIYLSI